MYALHVLVLNRHKWIINTEYFTVFNILVRIATIRTSLTVSSMILRSVYLLTLRWNYWPVELWPGLAVELTGLVLGTCGLVNIRATEDASSVYNSSNAVAISRTGLQYTEKKNTSTQQKEAVTVLSPGKTDFTKCRITFKFAATWNISTDANKKTSTCERNCINWTGRRDNM